MYRKKTSPENTVSADAEFTKLKRWFESACTAESNWRRESKLWFDYFHGDQLSQEVIMQMKARSQPPIKFNLIKSIVNLLTGQEIQGRTDVMFLGFEKSDDITAEMLTNIYRQKGHADNFQFEVTEAFQDSAVCGRGVLFIDWDEEEKCIVREHIDWKEIYLDPASKKPDFSDVRHVFRVKWVDKDIALDMFPDGASKLFETCASGDEYDFGAMKNNNKQDYFDEVNNDGLVQFHDSQRARVKLIEVWWKERDKVKTAIFCGNGFLKEPVIFNRKHNSFPFEFTYYERNTSNIPYGLVKDIIDPQDVINRMISKSMHILGTQQVLAEKGALKNTTNVQNNISRPDAVINDFEDGSLSSGKVQIRDNRQDAGLAFNHFEMAVNAMHRISGVNPELQGLSTNARSGTAISMRMRQGSTVLTRLYDCLEKIKKNSAKKYVYLMSQYFTDKKLLRYNGANGGLKEVVLNDTVSVQVGGDMQTLKVNQVKNIFEYDIVVTNGPAMGNQNEAEFTQLVELFKVVPMALTPLAISELIKSTHLPNKENLANSILQQATGAGNGTPTPEAPQMM